MGSKQPSAEFLAQDKRSGTIIACGICMGLALTTFVMRITARRLQASKLLASDFLAFAGLLCALTISIIVLNNARLGVGLHVQRVSLENIRTILLTSFIGEIFYGVGFTVIKLSILLLYRRIFTSRFVKIGTIVLGIFVICWGIAFVLVSIFACKPIEGYWNIMIKSECISQTDFYVAFSVPNMVADLCMMLLPLRDVWALQLHKSARVGICVLFALAGFVIIASGLRIHFMLTMDPADTTFTFVGVALWTAVEIDVAVMCSCLPTIRPVVGWCVAKADTLTSGWTSSFSSSRKSSKWSSGSSSNRFKSSLGGAQRPTKLPSRDGDTYRLTESLEMNSGYKEASPYTYKVGEV